MRKCWPESHFVTEGGCHDGQILTLLFDTQAARGIAHCPRTIDYFWYTAVSLATAGHGGRHGDHHGYCMSSTGFHTGNIE